MKLRYHRARRDLVPTSDELRGDAMVHSVVRSLGHLARSDGSVGSVWWDWSVWSVGSVGWRGRRSVVDNMKLTTSSRAPQSSFYNRRVVGR